MNRAAAFRTLNCRALLAAALLTVVLAAGCDGRSGGDGGANAGPAGDQQTAPQRGADGSSPVVGTFRAEGPVSGQEDGRLPAADDLAAYIPATALFPGTARIDPGVRNPYRGNADAEAAGERHFAAFNCSGCHAPLGGGGMGPPLSDDVWIYGGEPAQVYLSILHVRPEGMPAWGSMLPKRTIWELVAYIDTLNDIEDPAAAKGFDTVEVRTARPGRQ
jgi:cytochrome c oxidase cbb3-type subunit III